MKTNKLIAFHGESKIKRKYLDRVRVHRKADDIIAGQYWEATGVEGRFRGCAVGCTLHSSNHASYEAELGVPEVLARIEDRLFEGLHQYDAAAARMWPERFLAAIKPGADLSMVWPRFAHWLLIDPDNGVIRFAKKENAAAAVKKVAVLYAEWIAGNKPSTDRWSAAYADDAAAYAYADAAYAYAYAAYADDAAAYADDAAAYAAYAAAYAADAYAAYAAYAADAAAAADAADAADDDARGKHYAAMCEKLIALLKAA